MTTETVIITAVLALAAVTVGGILLAGIRNQGSNAQSCLETDFNNPSCGGTP